jgi:L-seryl-tRNA(Ser) seleniumtransferase
MSGDKMLGGPQAGIMLGRADLVDAVRRNPLARALRVDKMTLAALHATLRLYREPARAVHEIPTLVMLTTPPEEVAARATRLAARLSGAGVPCHSAVSEATVGGGAFPSARIPSSAVVLGGDAGPLERALRDGTPPVVGRIADGALWLDLRTVLPADDDRLATAVRVAVERAGAFAT